MKTRYLAGALLAALAMPSLASETRLAAQVPLASGPRVIELLQFYPSASVADGQVMIVNASSWRIEVLSPTSQPIVESHAQVSIDCESLAEDLMLVFAGEHGVEQTVGISAPCGSELLLTEAQPLSAVARQKE